VKRKDIKVGKGTEAETDTGAGVEAGEIDETIAENGTKVVGSRIKNTYINCSIIQQYHTVLDY
jgi:hypothetical protein